MDLQCLDCYFNCVGTEFGSRADFHEDSHSQEHSQGISSSLFSDLQLLQLLLLSPSQCEMGNVQQGPQLQEGILLAGADGGRECQRLESSGRSPGSAEGSVPAAGSCSCRRQMVVEFHTRLSLPPPPPSPTGFS